MTQQAKDASSQKASGLFGGSAFTNPNISLILDAFYYASNLTNDELANQGIPGFTTQGLDQRNGLYRSKARGVSGWNCSFLRALP